MGTGVQISWQLSPVVPATPTVLPSGAGVPPKAPSFLGFGIVTPFRRTANDFASASGAALVDSCVSQVLGTKCDSPNSSGELPWRTEFGSVLTRLRHKPNNIGLAALAQAYGIDAVTTWEPRATVTTSDTFAGKDGRALYVKFGYRLITANVAGNAVNLPDQSVKVPLG